MLCVTPAKDTEFSKFTRSGNFLTSMKKTGKKDPLAELIIEFKYDIYKYCEYLGVIPNWQQRELLDAYQDFIMGWGSPRIACRAGKGPGKCPTGDMLVYDKNMGAVRVADVEGKKLELLSMSKNMQMEYKKSTCKKSTVQDCTKIVTDSGNELKISSQHKVYTQRGWVVAKDVVVGDLMVVPREFEVKDGGVSEDICALLGYLVGDGGTSRRSGARFSQLDNGTLKRFISLVQKIGGSVRHIEKCDYYVKGIDPFLREHKLQGKLSKNKQIPEAVWVSGKRGIAAFLSALWECDGYVTKDGYGITLASKRLMLDIQTALASLGIHTSVRYKKCKCENKYFDAWRLGVCGSDNLKKWIDTIGSIPDKPLDNRNLRKKANSNKDIVPIKDVEWNYIVKELGVSNNKMRDYKYRGVKHACMGRGKFEAFAKQFNYRGKYKLWASSQVRWVKVRLCENIGDQQTYDISVEDNHNFVCNNLVVHNTKATAIIFTHWSLTHPKSRLVVTAPTFRQCQEVWLAEAYDTITSSQADPRISEMFTFRGKGYGIFGAKSRDWGCILVTALKKEAFQGQHRKYLAFLEEEASGVPTMISNAITETLSNAEGFWLHVRIGNPNTRLCPFFDCFNKEKNKWKCLHWNTEETPETEYFSRRRNKDIEEEFGKNSDVYRISVLGEFPNLDPNCLIAEEDLDDCCTEDTLTNVIQNNPDMTKQIGIDLARYGGDECVVVWRQGGVMLDMWADKTDPNNAIDKAIFGQDLYGWSNADCIYAIDTSGMGEAVVGVVGGEKYMGKRVHEFYSQGTPYHSDKYCDMITEAWCTFAKSVKNKQVYLGEKLDKKLKIQLTTRRYVVDRKTGKIRIESKDDYADNMKDAENGTIGKSPDRADGVVIGFYPYATDSTRVAAA